MLRRYLGIVLIIGLACLLARPASAATIWSDHFDGGTAFNQPAGWGDESDDLNFNAQIAYSCTSSLAGITRTADDVWGKVLAPTQTVNVAEYPLVEITVAACSSGVNWKLGIQEDEGSYAYSDLNPSSNATGTFSYNYATAMGWGSGTHRFKVVIIVEGAAGTWIEVDSVRIYSPPSTATPTATNSPTPDGNSPTHTPTVTSTPTQDTNSPTRTPTATCTPTQDTSSPTRTPTATATASRTPSVTSTAVITEYWIDHFNGAFGQQPNGWEDATDNAAFHAEIAYASAASMAAVTRTADTAGWGKVLSPVIYCNTKFYPRLEIRVAGLSPGASWNVGIQESGGNYAYFELSSNNTTTGTFSFDYNDLTGWNSDHAFQVQVAVVGSGGAYAVLDYVKIYAMEPVPTLTPTPVVDVAWFCPMEGEAGKKPSGWADEGDDRGKNLFVFYSGTGDFIGLTRSAEAKSGAVSSPALRMDTGRHPLLQISVRSVSAKTKWKVGIQETTRDKCYADLGVATGLTGTFTWNYAAAVAAENLIAWNGMRDFNVVLIVEGSPGSRVEVDALKVFSYNPDPTPTATPAAWLELQRVVAYPNPSRDRVIFAYRALGAVRVSLDIFKMTGERVASVQENKTGYPNEVLETVWNAVNAPPGIYFCRLTVTDVNGAGIWVDATKKIAIAK